MTASDFKADNNKQTSCFPNLKFSFISLLQLKHRFSSTVIIAQSGPRVILKDVRNPNKVNRLSSQELAMLPVYTAPKLALLALQL